MNVIIDYGFESENRRIRIESLVVLLIFIMLNLVYEDLFMLIKVFVGRLENLFRLEILFVVIFFERIKNVVGFIIFDSYFDCLFFD